MEEGNRKESGEKEKESSDAAYYTCGKVDKGTKVKDPEPKPGTSCDNTPDSPDNDVGFGSCPSSSSVGKNSPVK